MNIYALEGHKVKVVEQTANSGYKEDVELIRKHCVIDKEYTVDYTIVHSSSTDVYLKEIPNIRFNSVNFVDVSYQSEHIDIQHNDWDLYND